MGLDQYALRVRKNAVINNLSYKMVLDGQPTDRELYYWRKVPRLQGWMERLYREKGGEEVFNCECVKLEPADLDRLEKDVRKNRLPPTSGYFFGRHCESDMKYILDFIGKARKVIEEGDAVYYSSWW